MPPSFKPSPASYLEDAIVHAVHWSWQDNARTGERTYRGELKGASVGARTTFTRNEFKALHADFPDLLNVLHGAQASSSNTDLTPSEEIDAETLRATWGFWSTTCVTLDRRDILFQEDMRSPHYRVVFPDTEHVHIGHLFGLNDQANGTHVLIGTQYQLSLQCLPSSRPYATGRQTCFFHVATPWLEQRMSGWQNRKLSASALGLSALETIVYVLAPLVSYSAGVSTVVQDCGSTDTLVVPTDFRS